MEYSLVLVDDEEQEAERRKLVLWWPKVKEVVLDWIPRYEVWKEQLQSPTAGQEFDCERVSRFLQWRYCLPCDLVPGDWVLQWSNQWVKFCYILRDEVLMVLAIRANVAAAEDFAKFETRASSEKTRAQ
jgi:hypothetical protein